MRRKKNKNPIMLNLRGNVMLESVNDKLCRCCQRSTRTKTYSFNNIETSWSRQWCKKCFKHWRAKSANSKPQIHLMTVSPLSWWRRALKRAEEYAMSANQQPRG